MSGPRAVCVHAHWYQPPREDPWLGAMPRDKAAAPHHDWNERICAESYRPSSAARIVDETDGLVEIFDAIAHLSSDVGPTLHSWLERWAPDVDESFRDADATRRCMLAAPYVHAILPLATERDRTTLVRWGITDFRRRFGHAPRGMWLPETGVDTATLETLAAEGIELTVLAASQAARVRPFGGEWEDVGGGVVDSRRAYRVELPSGRSIIAFFANAALSHGIAFDGLLDNGDRLTSRIRETFGASEEPQLVHLITDGETFGHHHRYGEMALAWSLRTFEQDPTIELTHYAEFLDRHPVTHEAQIVERSSWSCAHGLERWRSGCGCSTGGAEGWSQEWRTPLREAFDWLQERLSVAFESAGVLADPWAARDAYVDVIIEPTTEARDRFLDEHAPDADERGRVRALQLLEMQRHMLTAFTSCGWFFADPAGTETVMVLRRAARALDLVEEALDLRLLPELQRRLASIRSNDPAEGDVRAIWHRQVRRRVPAMVHAARSHAAWRSIGSEETSRVLLGHRIETIDEREADTPQGRRVAGRIRVVEMATRQASVVDYVAVRGEGLCLVGATRPVPPSGADEPWDALEAELPDRAALQAEALAELLGGESWTYEDLHVDERAQLAVRVFDEHPDGRRAGIDVALEAAAHRVLDDFDDHQSLSAMQALVDLAPAEGRGRIAAARAVLAFEQAANALSDRLRTALVDVAEALGLHVEVPRPVVPVVVAGDPLAEATGAADLRVAVAELERRLPGALRPLARVAYNYCWSWQPDGPETFAALDPHRWDLAARNPVRLLSEASPSALARAATDGAYVARVRALARRVDEELATARTPIPGLGGPVAFFCAEFGIHASLPIYSGGLGILAGDILKECSDQGRPVVGVGLLYRRGYFHQRVDAHADQQEYWIENDVEHLPAVRVTDASGDPMVVSITAWGKEIALQVWRVDVGRVPLYLLDAELPQNRPVDRWITSRLYEGNRAVRLAQYVALGVGGVRALEAAGITPSAVHMNEGHPALSTLEQVAEAVATGQDFDAALAAVRARTVFTTHTPLPAGNETYDRSEILAVMGDMPVRLGIDEERFLGMGRIHPDDAGEQVGLTPVALRASRSTNGVSEIHGRVARGMWQPLFGSESVEATPITHVTNGVHLPTWMAPPMRHLLDRHLKAGWERRAADPATWAPVADIPDAELWAVRNELRATLVEEVRSRSAHDQLARGEQIDIVEEAEAALHPDLLTVGFARRVARYKRIYLFGMDRERALGLLAHDPPVQLLWAGKAHPSDDDAKAMLRSVIDLQRAPEARGRAVFLEDYDLSFARALVAGCDVWVNLPRPPLEASGTSGMKSVLNGGLQLSVLDGWWAEVAADDNGWSIDGTVDDDWDAQDQRDAAALYDLLEQQVRPLFCDRDAEGLPVGWLARVRRSLGGISPFITATRMIDDYVRDVYPPA